MKPVLQALIIAGVIALVGCGGDVGVDVVDKRTDPVDPVDPQPVQCDWTTDPDCPCPEDQPDCRAEPDPPVSVIGEYVTGFVTIWGKNLLYNNSAANKAVRMSGPGRSMLHMLRQSGTGLNASGIRMVVDWDKLQGKEGGDFNDPEGRGDDYGFYKNLIMQTYKNGMQPMIAFGNAPGWAKGSWRSGPPDLETLKGWVKDYIDFVATEVIPEGYKIRYVQLWDEDDGNDFGGYYKPEMIAFIGSYLKTLPQFEDALRYLSVDVDTVRLVHKKDWMNETNQLMGIPDVNAAVDVIGIKHFPGTRWGSFIVGRNEWRALGDLRKAISKSGKNQSNMYGKQGAVLETGFSTYTALHAGVSQQLWINTSLARMAYHIKQSTKNDSEYKIMSWGWNQFTDTPWRYVVTQPWRFSHFGITYNNTAALKSFLPYGKKPGFRALKRRIRTTSNVCLKLGKKDDPCPPMSREEKYRWNSDDPDAILPDGEGGGEAGGCDFPEGFDVQEIVKKFMDSGTPPDPSEYPDVNPDDWPSGYPDNFNPADCFPDEIDPPSPSAGDACCCHGSWGRSARKCNNDPDGRFGCSAKDISKSRKCN